LTENIQGVGEHVIPKNIFGHWRIYDVCEECMKYFGNNVDQLALNNVFILEAIDKLGLKNTNRLYEQLPFVGEDTQTGRKTDMLYRQNTFQVKSKRDPGYIACPEDILQKGDANWFRSIIGRELSASELEEISNLSNQYKVIEPGDEIHSKVLNLRIKKQQVKSIRIDQEALPPITPLICKIAYCFLMYIDQSLFVGKDDIVRIHARYSKTLPSYKVNWCSRENFREEYGKMHGLILHTNGPFPILDISLFK
jgi:hypothetical protein